MTVSYRMEHIIRYHCGCRMAWLIKAGLVDDAGPLTLYVLQLVLKSAWSALFFGLRRMDLAFGVLQLLWLAILANVVPFYMILPVAGWLLVPYLCWFSPDQMLDRGDPLSMALVIQHRG